MPFTLADAEIILGALAQLDRIESTQLRFVSDMASFKETVIAAFTFAKARIAELEAQNVALASNDAADQATIAAKTEEVAAAKVALEEAIATDTAEDSEILAAAAEFIVPAEEPPVEEVPVEGQG